MHAHLLIGNNTVAKEAEIQQQIGGKMLEFPILKIEEVRQLSKFLKTTQNQNTIIISRNIDEATHEALNAFLKNLEEPQKNVTFVLTAINEYKILPTVISRCQVTKVANTKSQINNETKNKDFLMFGKGDQLSVVDKIKSRSEAIEFSENVIFTLHNLLKDSKTDYKKYATNMEAAQKTLNNLKANGNVSLQLTNLVANLRS